MKKILIVLVCGVILCMTPFIMSTEIHASTSVYDGMVELGNDHTLVLTKEGILYAFGRNLYGQIGDGSGENQLSPVDLTSSFVLNQDEIIIDIAAGGASSGIVTNQGRVFTWGANGDGQLGDGTYEDKATPVEITSHFTLNDGEIIEQIDMGNAFTSVVTSEGRVFIWGSSGSNQLGDTAYPYGSNEPIDLTPSLGLNENETILDIELGSIHALAITSDYRILAWGDNDDGECGVAASNNEPTAVDITSVFGFSGNEHVLFVSAGEAVSYVVSNEGTVFSFGKNSDFELGDGTQVTPVAPINVTSQFSLGENETVLAISSGTYFSTLVTSTGRLFVWGQNWYEALGTGTSSTQENPYEITSRVTLDTTEKVVYTVSSKYFSAIITSYGDVHMWGRGDRGQLGVGTTDNLDIPTFNGLNVSEPDTTPPTCDETLNQTIEAGQYTDIDWTTYITGVEDAGGAVTLMETDDPVQYDTVGTYTVSIDLTDTSENVYTETFNVTVVDTTAPMFDPIPDQIIEIDSDAIDWTTYITNVQDNATGTLTPVLVIDNIEYDIAGTYTVTVKLVDESLNETQQTFSVQVVIGTPHPQYRTIIQEQFDPYHYYEMFGASKVAIGLGHTMVLTAAGELFTWGFNESGQLGDGTQTDSIYEINITDNFNLDRGDVIIDIQATFQQSMALTKNGRLFYWGCNDLPIYPTDCNITMPYEITNRFSLLEDEYIVSFQMDFDQVLVSTSLNRIFVYGETDQNMIDTLVSDLDQINDSIEQIKIGSHGGAILTHLGSVYTWGWNGYGQLGDGSTVEWSDGVVDVTNQIPLHEDETITELFYTSLSVEVVTSEQRVLHWGYYKVDEPSAAVGRYETSEIMDITDDFDFEEGEYIVTVYRGMYSAIFVTSHNRVFSMCDYLFEGEVTGNRDYVVDQTSVINPKGLEIIDFDMDQYNWAWVLSDGSIHTFGDNTYGQLGTEGETITPVEVGMAFNEFFIDPLPYWDFVKVSTGGTHTLALTSLGEVFAWGDNQYGQLGTGDTTSTPTLVRVTENLNLIEGELISDIYAGVGYSIFITTNDRILVVGLNDQGQLGISNFINQLTITDITNRFSFYPNERIDKISLYGSHNLLLTTEGRLFSWGANSDGQVGNGSLSDIPTPQDITPRLKSSQTEYIVDIAAGAYHSLAITSLDRVFAWGKNSYGEIGNGSVSDYVTVPLNITSYFQLNPEDRIIQVAAGGWHSFALSEAGMVYSWGRNDYGQLGNATTVNQSLPAIINAHFTLENEDTIIDIQAGTNTGFFITEQGVIFAWGDNYYQQLGYTSTGDFEDTPVNITPIIIAGTEDVPIIDFAVKGLTSFFLSDENRIYSAGYNLFGQLGQDFTSYHEPLDEIHYDLTGDINIWYIDVKPETVVNDETILLKIYPTENWGIYIDTIAINDTSYSDFTLNYGVIEIELDNSYNVGEYAEFKISGGTMFNGQSFSFILNNYTATTIIEDNIPPEFDLLDQTINIDDLASDFSDWTIYVENTSDNSGGEVILTVVSTDIENPKIPGIYTITIQAEDEVGNTNEQSCEITLIDTVAPVLSQLPEMMETIMANDYTNFEWTTLVTQYSDNSDAPIILTEEDGVVYDTPGTYLVRVIITDSSGNFTVVRITVTVTEDTRPRVTLNPGVDTFYTDGVWIDPGVTITNSSGTTLTVTGINQLDEDTPGTYPIIYTVSSDDMDDIVIVRYVTVLPQDTTLKVTFTLNSAITTITSGNTYIDTGCTATDGTATYQCIIQSNNVNIYIQGTYQVIYYVTIDGVTYTKTRYVFVVSDMVIPDLYFIKEEEVTIQ